MHQKLIVAVFVAVTLPITVFAQKADYTFNHITKKDGLDAEFISAIKKDKSGYLWLGSNSGFIRYDGKTFKRFSYSFSDTTSISNNNINNIFEDSSGKLWISTNQGLNRYDPINEKFKRYLHDPYDPASISGNEVTEIVEDTNGNLWIGTLNGLNKFNLTTHKFTQYTSFVDFGKENVRPAITGIIRDQTDPDLIWIAGEQGFGSFRLSTQEFVPHIVQEQENKNINLVSKKVMTRLVQDKAGIIWLGNYYGELFRFSPKDYSVKKFLLDSSWTKGYHHFSQIFKYNEHQLWIVGIFPGIKIFDTNTYQVSSLTNDPDLLSSLLPDTIFCLYKDDEGIIWITQSNSISKLDPYLQYFSNWNFGKEKKEKIRGIGSITKHGNDIYFSTDFPPVIHKLNWDTQEKTEIPIPEDFKIPSIVGPILRITELLYNADKEEFWMNTDNDVVFFHIPTETFTPISKRYSLPAKSDYSVAKIYQDSKGFFWIAYYLSGLIRVNPNTKEVVDFTKQLSNFKNAPKVHKLYDITEDKNGKIWVATHAGIRVIDPQTERTIRLADYIPNAGALMSLKTLVFAKDKHENIWIGTLGNGLFKVSFDNKTPKVIGGIGIDDGLPDNNINNLLFDNDGILWAGSHAGLSRINTESNEIKNFNTTDGLDNDHMGNYSMVVTPNGKLLIGGQESLLVLDQKSMPIKNIPPPVVIDQLTIHRSDTVIQRKGVNSSSISLPYFENNLEISFSVLNFTKPMKNKFKYQLIGAQDFWIETDVERSVATFTNLDPGNYTFKVIAANHDGVWNNKGAFLNITILPPPWRTWWAYTLYFICIVSLFFISRKEFIKRERLKTKAKIQSLETAKYQELDTLKSRFFANISHEFRTPLTLILGPIEKRLALASSENDKVELSLVQRNAKRLLNLVNQLLDISRLEMKALHLHCKPSDINLFVKTIVSQFQSMAVSKKIKFEFIPTDAVIVFIDNDKLDKIIFNLLSNAFKFTPTGESIRVELQQGIDDPLFKEGYIEIKVTDTGRGIESEHLDKIFDRFYQVENSTTREFEGAGIGLALTKEAKIIQKI